MVMRMADGQIPVSQLISSGVCDRHPTLQFVIVECGAGWLAWLLYALDEQAEKKHMWIRPQLSMKPSEFFARQGHVTFTDDPVALQTISFIGADCLLWGQRLSARRGVVSALAGRDRSHVCRALRHR